MADLISSINEDKSVRNIELAITGAAKRHSVIANNIANVDTPNFKRSDVAFQDILKKAVTDTSTLTLNVTHKNHMTTSISSASPLPIVQDTASTMRNDGNNVDIERETAAMVKNDVLYNTYVQLLKSKLGSLKGAIEEGGR